MRRSADGFDECGSPPVGWDSGKGAKSISGWEDDGHWPVSAIAGLSQAVPSPVHPHPAALVLALALALALVHAQYCIVAVVYYRSAGPACRPSYLNGARVPNKYCAACTLRWYLPFLFTSISFGQTTTREREIQASREPCPGLPQVQPPSSKHMRGGVVSLVCSRGTERRVTCYQQE